MINDRRPHPSFRDAIDRVRSQVFILLFFFLFAVVLFSQRYLVHHYRESDGLPSAEVYDMTRDQWGRLWFATRVGIVFYGIFQLVSGKRHATVLERKVQERTSQLQEVEKQYRGLFEESKDMGPPFMWFCPNLEEK